MGQTTRHTLTHPSSTRQARHGTITDELQGTNILWLRVLYQFVLCVRVLCSALLHPLGFGWLLLD